MTKENFRSEKMLICFYSNVYLFILREGERERVNEHEQERGRERGRERIPSRLHTVGPGPDAGLNPRDQEIMI